MASLLKRPNGRWSLQFFADKYRRQTIPLGQLSEAQAGTIKERVEALIEAIRADVPPDRSTAVWVRKLDDHLHVKLAKVGLVVARHAEAAAAVTTLKPFLDSYISGRTDVKPATIEMLGNTARNLIGFFGATRPLDRIAPGEADDFRLWLADDQHLADNTVRRRCGFAKQFFRAALRKRLIRESPFAEMKKCAVRKNSSREYFVSLTEAVKVLDACPDATWRLLFALARYGGLRCPSEHLALRWSGVDWERSRMTVVSPKTEHYPGGESRIVPIFPELRPYLKEVWDQAEPGTEFVITKYRDRTTNLRTRLVRIIQEAGLEPWPRLWQNLRATRETELAAKYPIHFVCRWLGNSILAASEFYLQVVDEHFERASDEAAAKNGDVWKEQQSKTGSKK